MDIKPGKKYSITGMEIEILSDHSDKWETRNITTNEIIYMNKDVLEKAIKLGKAEEIIEEYRE